jgi:hypothetical protein
MRFALGAIEMLFGFLFLVGGMFTLQNPELRGLAFAILAIGGSAMAIGMYFMVTAGKKS